MTYDMPSNITGIQGVLDYANYVSGGWFFNLVILAIIVIIFVTLRRFGHRTSDCMFASTFIAFAVGSLFWAGGVVSGQIIMITLVAVILSGIYSLLDS